MMNKYGAFIIPFILLSCLLITGLLIYQNVNARRHEIGILKAIGSGTWNILFMVLAKALILGFLGSLMGFFTGSYLAEYFGKEIFRFTAFTIIAFPVLWMVAGWLPALIASRVDAAKTLSEE
jgi:ABC-type antimicrobial peptide transport system permease subunit